MKRGFYDFVLTFTEVIPFISHAIITSEKVIIWYCL